MRCPRRRDVSGEGLSSSQERWGTQLGTSGVVGIHDGKESWHKADRGLLRKIDTHSRENAGCLEKEKQSRLGLGAPRL